MKYHQQKDGEWIQLIGRKWKIRCCDCGLVHKLNFRIKNNKIHVQAFRDNRATAAYRKRTTSNHPMPTPTKEQLEAKNSL
jgi:hypothetical protein